MRNVCDPECNKHSDSSKSVLTLIKDVFSNSIVTPSWIGSILASDVKKKNHHNLQESSNEPSLLRSVWGAPSRNLKRKGSYRDIEEFATEARRIRIDSWAENNVNSTANRVWNTRLPNAIKTKNPEISSKSRYIGLSSCSKGTQANLLSKSVISNPDMPAYSSFLRKDISRTVKNASHHCPTYLKPLPSYKSFKALLDYSTSKNGMSETAAKVLNTITRKEAISNVTIDDDIDSRDYEVSHRRDFDYGNRNEYYPATESSCVVDVNSSGSEEVITYGFRRPPPLIVKRTRLSDRSLSTNEYQSVRYLNDFAGAPAKRTCTDTERRQESKLGSGNSGLSGEENIRSIVRDELLRINAKNKDMLAAETETQRQQQPQEQQSVLQQWICNACYHPNVSDGDKCRFCKRKGHTRPSNSTTEETTEPREGQVAANSNEAKHPVATASDILVIPNKQLVSVSSPTSAAVCTDAQSLLRMAESNTSSKASCFTGLTSAKLSSDKSDDKCDPSTSVTTTSLSPKTDFNSKSENIGLPQSPKRSVVEASKLPAFEFSANSSSTISTLNSVTVTSKDAGNMSQGSELSLLSSAPTVTSLAIVSVVSNPPGLQTSPTITSNSLFSFAAPVSTSDANRQDSQSVDAADTKNVNKSIFGLPVVSSAEKPGFTFASSQVSQPGMNPFSASQPISTTSSSSFLNMPSTEGKSNPSDAVSSMDFKKPSFNFASSQSSFRFDSTPVVSTLSFNTSALPTFGQAFTAPEVKPAFGTVDVSLNNTVAFPSFGSNAVCTEQKQPSFGSTFNAGTSGSQSGSWFNSGSSNPTPAFNFNGGSAGFGQNQTSNVFNTNTSTTISPFLPSSVSGFAFAPAPVSTQSSDQMNTTFFGSVSSTSPFAQNKTETTLPGFNFFGQNQSTSASSQKTDNFSLTSSFSPKPFIFGQPSNTAAATTAPTFPIQVPSTFNFMNNASPKFKFDEPISQAGPSAPFIFGEHHNANNPMPTMNDMSNPFSVKPDSIAGRKFKTGRRRIKH